MKKLFLLFSFSFLLFSCKSDDNTGTDVETPETSDRYNAQVFTDIAVTTAIPYGMATTQGGVNQQLLLDFYQPNNDTETQRPLVIFAHGGGFVGGTRSDMVTLTNYFAQAGYATASITYRLVDVPPVDWEIAYGVIDATHDLRAAVRFFRANASEYGINPNKIYVGGYSAGAFMALHLAYMKEISEVNEFGGSVLTNYINARGGIEGNSGNPGFSSEVQGVINIAGALGKASFVDSGEAPLWSFHGTNDMVVPYLSGDADGSGITTEGSGLIHAEADEEGVYNVLKTAVGGNHAAIFSCLTCPQEMRSFIFGLL